jgi:hypothetical protein
METQPEKGSSPLTMMVGRKDKVSSEEVLAVIKDLAKYAHELAEKKTRDQQNSKDTFRA